MRVSICSRRGRTAASIAARIRPSNSGGREILPQHILQPRRIPRGQVEGLFFSCQSLQKLPLFHQGGAGGVRHQVEQIPRFVTLVGEIGDGAGRRRDRQIRHRVKHPVIIPQIGAVEPDVRLSAAAS